MKIKQTVRGKGSRRNVTLTTALEAIERHCGMCSYFGEASAYSCSDVECNLFHYRLGTDPLVEKPRNNKEQLGIYGDPYGEYLAGMHRRF